MTEHRSTRRLRALSVAVAAIVGVLVWRLVDIQIVGHEQYIEQAKRQCFERKLIPARRGHVFDRNGFPLAVTRWTYDVGVTPAHFPIEKKRRSRVWPRRALSPKKPCVANSPGIALPMSRSVGTST